jgi:hypothetical protein
MGMAPRLAMAWRMASLGLGVRRLASLGMGRPSIRLRSCRALLVDAVGHPSLWVGLSQRLLTLA